MNRNILSVLGFAVLGLIIGYAIFGKLLGDYVSLKTLFSFGGNAFHRAFQSVSDIEEIRNKVLLSGVAGAVVGALLTFKLKR